MVKCNRLGPVALALILSGKTLCQQPGGKEIPGPKYWIATQVENGRAQWFDKLNNIRISNISDTRSIVKFNFNPGLLFSGTPQKFNLHNVVPNTVFSVFYPNRHNTGNTDSIYSIRFNGTRLQKLQNASFIAGTGSPSSYSPNFIVNNDVVWSTSMKPVAAWFASPSLQRSDPPAGNDRETQLTIGLNGYCPEMLIYEQTLSDTAAWKVNTYFSIKYGLTQDRSYLGTDNTILWNKDKYNLFHHRVSAIGSDPQGALIQFKSNTTYEELDASDPLKYCSFENSSHDVDRSEAENVSSPRRNLTMGFDTKEQEHMPDRKFLFWGDNNTPVAQTATVNYASGQIMVTGRKWIMTNEEDFKGGTTVEMAGQLLETFNGDDKAFFLIKLDGSLDSTDFFPLSLSNEGKTLYFRMGIHWPKAVDTFTFGSGVKLSYRDKICRPKKHTCTKDNEYIYKKNNFLFFRNCTRKRIGYHYRTPYSEILPGCNVQPLSPRNVELFIHGGIGPVRFFFNGVEKTAQKIDDATFRVQDVEDGSYTVMVTDMTRQEVSMDIVVKRP